MEMQEGISNNSEPSDSVNIMTNEGTNPGNIGEILKYLLSICPVLRTFMIDVISAIWKSG